MSVQILLDWWKFSSLRTCIDQRWLINLKVREHWKPISEVLAVHLVIETWVCANLITRLSNGYVTRLTTRIYTLSWTSKLKLSDDDQWVYSCSKERSMKIANSSANFNRGIGLLRVSIPTAMMDHVYTSLGSEILRSSQFCSITVCPDSGQFDSRTSY